MLSNYENERMEFEAWARVALHDIDAPNLYYHLNTDGTVFYSDDSVDMAWFGWLARSVWGESKTIENR